MYRGSMFYGRKGLPVAVISVIDLAIWDLLGKIRNEPVYKMIGGATREKLSFYCTGPAPEAAKEMGFTGAKVPLPVSLSKYYAPCELVWRSYGLLRSHTLRDSQRSAM